MHRIQQAVWIQAELISADIPGFLLWADRRGIVLKNVEIINELTVRFLIRERNFTEADSRTEDSGETLRILRQAGLRKFTKQLLRRPVLSLGLMALSLFMLWIPSRIFFIEVEGNERIPSRQILAGAEACGIRFGASRKDIRSEQVKNSLLNTIPDLRWAGVNTRGCVAVLQVREREPEPEQRIETGISGIEASRDGVILSGTVTAGTALFKPGDAVTAGQLLISGYTDCGKILLATRAEGEIRAATMREFSAVTPVFCHIRRDISRYKQRFSLVVGKNRINFYKGSGNLPAGCVKMVTKYDLTLPGGYRLPVSLLRETFFTGSEEKGRRDPRTVRMLLKSSAERFLKEDMAEGEILAEAAEFLEREGLWTYKSRYACSELIGRVRNEQNGE